MNESLMNELRNDIGHILRACTSDYAERIQRAIEADIIQDVKECAVAEEGSYTEDDIKLAVGRVLIDRMGISY